MPAPSPAMGSDRRSIHRTRSILFTSHLRGAVTTAPRNFLSDTVYFLATSAIMNLRSGREISEEPRLLQVPRWRGPLQEPCHIHFKEAAMIRGKAFFIIPLTLFVLVLTTPPLHAG